MKFSIHGEKVSISPAMRQQIEKKLSFLERYLVIDENTTARVVCKNQVPEMKVEVSIPTKFGLLRSEVTHPDFYAALDMSIDKLEDQLRRQKTRLSRRHRESLSEYFLKQEVEQQVGEVVRTKNIHADTMSLDDAIVQMELLGHSFFIYRDSESEVIAVVYKRNNGGYGLIEIDE